MDGSNNGRAAIRVVMLEDPLPQGCAAINWRCSTIGPSASAGMNVNAPTMSTTLINNTTKSGVCVGSVPGPGGTIFFRAREPAIASVGIASQ